MAARRAAPAGAAIAFLAMSFAATPAAHAAASSSPAAHSEVGRGASDGPASAVIVEATSVAAATNAVVAVGGHVDLTLALVDGVAARVPSGAVAELTANSALRVMPDATLHPTGASFRPVSTTTTVAGIDPQIAALDSPDAGAADAGHGVAIALVDTGVTDTPDLHGSRLVRGPDFSGEGDGIDHYGHGTFMAGLIAGDGTASASTSPRHAGVAPAATLVSVKVAGADGSTSVSKIIAAIGWVISHRDTYGIDVLNLSFGVDAPMPYRFNPLSAAVEAAWASGVTVVVSAGNSGDGHVTSPGSDPYVITVGAADTGATVATADDAVPDWSGRQRFRHFSKPDVVAPGVSVVSLRAPGSTIDVGHPEGRIDATYFRGTGTSMSTALVAGAAAVLLGHHPAATPDDVKGALVDGAVTISGPNRAAGAGEIDLSRADRADARPDWWQHYRVAFDGLDRGLDRGMPWTATRWTATRWTATRWTATRWTATRWTDAEWSATRWTSDNWTATRWTATRWTSTRWTSEAWPSQSWG